MLQILLIMLKHGFDHITKEFSRKQVMTIQNKLLKYAENIENEKLYRPKTSILCEYCDYCESCPAGLDFIHKKSNVSNYGAQSWA